MSKKLEKKNFPAVFMKVLGNITAACNQLGINNDTYHQWYKEDEEFAKKCDMVQEISLDFVESKMFKQIDGGDTTMIIFYLKCKGKKRGYIDKQIVELNQNHKVEVTLNLKGYTDDELRTIERIQAARIKRLEAGDGDNPPATGQKQLT